MKCSIAYSTASGAHSFCSGVRVSIDPGTRLLFFSRAARDGIVISLFILRRSRFARLPLHCSAECAILTNASLFVIFARILANAPPLMIHSALALFAQRTRIPTSARSIGFCVIWVCISSSSSSSSGYTCSVLRRCAT